MNETNWSTLKPNVTENDIKALAKAKRMEKKLEKDGWKWIKINPRTMIFVPCDKEGKPTKKGEEMIKVACANVVTM